MLNPATIIVSFEPPHCLLAIKAETTSVLGFPKQHLQGRTLKVFHGPRTDAIMISSAIESASVFTTVTLTNSLQLELCEYSGQCRAVQMTFVPFFDALGFPIACEVSFELSQAITIENAMEDGPCPKILISADRPHCIYVACSQASEMLGLSSTSFLLGQPIASFAALPANLSSLAYYAAAGRRQRDTVLFRTSAHNQIHLDVAFIPVVPHIGAQVSHVLLLLADPATPSSRPPS
eukprot:CAMPEP_0172171488 /NCGR_PEP_ID=MMETSP1050-20130122/11922_1 /TAXON_ID=233186 /ORGANISM="Cryptomonas curvata, Strain CCAP979/52" /LENGTH=234 /DNA_ID=CAMNT_0012842929 /DNA_START=51 /DNA_END=751 /DNA_ORIENTATION=+